MVALTISRPIYYSQNYKCAPKITSLCSTHLIAYNSFIFITYILSKASHSLVSPFPCHPTPNCSINKNSFLTKTLLHYSQLSSSSSVFCILYLSIPWNTQLRNPLSISCTESLILYCLSESASCKVT